MLKKINRGLKRKDFEVSRSRGKVYQSPLFGVSVIKKEGVAQVGFMISKKISKKAVDRNKIKRKLCEVIGKSINNEKINNYKIVILVKKNILGAKIEDIEKSWSLIYEKLNSENSGSV